MKYILSLCDISGYAVKPWVDAGYTAICVDLSFPRTDLTSNPIRIKKDVRDFTPPDLDYAFAFAFPPCNNLATSGAQYFKAKGLRVLAESLLLVAACANIMENLKCPGMLENPVSTLSSYWRKPDFMYTPYQYAGYLPPERQRDEAYSKRTCIWTFNNPVIPEPKEAPGEFITFKSYETFFARLHLPKRLRPLMRALTPKGWSKAVFLANSQFN